MNCYGMGWDGTEKYVPWTLDKPSYSTSFAIWQQGLENLKTNVLTMFLGFQKLLSILRLIIVESLFTV